MTTNDRVVVIGASGFGRECLDVLDAMIAAGSPVDVLGVVDDVNWCAGVLAEMDLSLQVRPDSSWGKAARMARVQVSGQLSGLMKSASSAERLYAALSYGTPIGCSVRKLDMHETGAFKHC